GFLGAFGDALYGPASPGADTFSSSAVGHKAFAELLRRLGFKVVVSRARTAERAAGGAVALLLEPQLSPAELLKRQVGPADDSDGDKFKAIEAASGALLVVLPKRWAIPDSVRPGRVAFADLLPLDAPQRVLARLDREAKVVRPERAVGSWKGPLPAPTLDRPQLVTSKLLQPLLACDAGILVGELVGEEDDEDDEDAASSPPVAPWRTIVVADPDLLATHGLGAGANATIMVRLLERLGAGEHPIVIDETLHGFEQQPSLARELLRFPLAPATASALLVAALLAWGAFIRFGRPRPPEPLLKQGRLALVESTAGLLRQGGHFAHAAAAYLRAAKEGVAHRLRPTGEAGEDPAWLAEAAEAKGRGGALREIEARVQRLAARRVGGEEEAVRTAQAIHQWREEMTDGADGDPRHDRAAAG
ncbi:MAG: hypothetical protein WCC48_13240, partial [Anaeromyxobacteraceae bacterium]